MSYYFERYQQFISKVDELTEKLSGLHKDHMQCRKGCDLCCMNYRIFPVEYRITSYNVCYTKLLRMIPFELFGKKLTDKQAVTLATKKKSPTIKGFTYEDLKIDGKLIISDDSEIILNTEIKEDSTCPECNVGKIVKGKTAYGCTNFKAGCNFRIPFEVKAG